MLGAHATRILETLRKRLPACWALPLSHMTDNCNALCSHGQNLGHWLPGSSKVSRLEWPLASHCADLSEQVNSFQPGWARMDISPPPFPVPTSWDLHFQEALFSSTLEGGRGGGAPFVSQRTDGNHMLIHYLLLPFHPLGAWLTLIFFNTHIYPFEARCNFAPTSQIKNQVNLLAATELLQGKRIV